MVRAVYYVRRHVQELQLVLEKLVKFIGKNVRNVVERADEKYCFRLHNNRVFYVRETLVKKATNVRSASTALEHMYILSYVCRGCLCCRFACSQHFGRSLTDIVLDMTR